MESNCTNCNENVSPPTNSDGRSCHPGEDYQCRCIGRPVFNKNTLNLPVDDSVNITIK